MVRRDPDVAELVYAEAPTWIRALPSASVPDPPEPSSDLPPERLARTWWNADENSHYRHWDASIAYLRQLCQDQGPFDGVLGFSQGACVAGVLSAALEHPDLAQQLGGPVQDRPFRFVISMSGFRPADKRFDPLFQQPLRTPALVLVGMYVVRLTPGRTPLCRQSARRPTSTCARRCVCCAIHTATIRRTRTSRH